MDPSFRVSALVYTVSLLALISTSRSGVLGATFTFVNKCEYTVWPGILANAGTPSLGSTGFELPEGSSRSFQAPAGWSGRFWGRTGCNFDSSSSTSCQTADCGSGQVECNGLGAVPPATLAEFTMGTGSQDFYDVSLVDGYNLPLLVEPTHGTGECTTTGCLADLNQQCPTELKAEGGGACKSACGAFGSPEYCCSGAYSSPATCRPTIYSEMFKAACPRSYSYAYDDATSTFTCAGADYTITFCPSSASQKSSHDNSSPVPTTTIPPPATSQGSGSDFMSNSGSEFDFETGPGYELGSGHSESDTGFAEGGSGALLADGSYLADLAMGCSPSMMKSMTPFALLSVLALLLALLHS